ncbi:hypothetical protein RHGRI_024522 [Rhododendron griersonianum]|uniref:Glycine-rich protein n=1 Tax=Rhododendron griersonianum TaxID=479676 RepID=A0AAV6J9P0_9ERIC|nr:hypothetical protein RHGRI_024522 [Rhododendron griersonianum]
MEGTFTTSIQELVCCAPMLWCGGGVLVWVGVVVVQTAGVVREKNGEKGEENGGGVFKTGARGMEDGGFSDWSGGFWFQKTEGAEWRVFKKNLAELLGGRRNDNFGSSWLF